MERNNRTPTIIFSYFKPHPTLDTNLELNAELLLLFSFTYDSFLPCFPDCKCSLWGSNATSNMHGVCCRQQPHQAACCWCADWELKLIAGFKLTLLGGKIPGQDKNLSYTNRDAKPARSEWILQPDIAEGFQPQSWEWLQQRCAHPEGTGPELVVLAGFKKQAERDGKRQA